MLNHKHHQQITQPNNKNYNTTARPVILASRQYPQGGVTTSQHNRPAVILASRQYPQGGDGRARQTVIADLIRNPEVKGRAAVIPSIPTPSFPRRRESTGRGQPGTTDRHCRLDPQSRGDRVGHTTSQNNQPYPLSLDGRGLG